MTHGPDGGYPVAGPEMSDRYDWIDLYARRHACSDEYRSIMEQQEAQFEQFRQQGVQQLLGMASILRQSPASGTEQPQDFFEMLADREKQLRMGQEELKVQPFNFEIAMHELDQRANDNTTRYNAVEAELDARHLRIGDVYELDGVTPPAYILRAIGHPDASVAGLWSRACGSIIGFRIATAEAREHITLGTGTGEAWSQDALFHVVDIVQHLQLLQIATNSDPETMAKTLGRAELLQQVGMPPTPTTENLHWNAGSWLHDALQYLKIIEPQHGGLQIDIDARRLG